MNLKEKYPLLPTLITIVLFTTLMGLGTWQVHRLEWKTNLLSVVELKTSQPIATLEQVLEESNPEEWQYRRIKVKGKFLHEDELYLMPRSYMGMPGYQVITPFQVATGEVILVNRGWVPIEHQASVIARIEEEQEVIGSIRLDQEQRFFHPQNAIEKKEIFYVSTAEISKAFGLRTLLPFYLIEEPREEKPYSWPNPAGSSSINMVNNHFMYAVIWYALGAILLLFYGFYMWQHRSGRLSNISPNVLPENTILSDNVMRVKEIKKKRPSAAAQKKDKNAPKNQKKQTKKTSLKVKLKGKSKVKKERTPKKSEHA